MASPVRAFEMKVGAKGGGKHWTKAQIEARAAAEAKIMAPGAMPSMPHWLNSQAKAVWEKTVKALQDMNILDRADAEILAAYCDATVRAKNLARKIDEEGYLMESPQGVKANPLVSVHQNYLRIQMSHAEKLGISAAARAKLARREGKEKEKDPNGELFGD